MEIGNRLESLEEFYIERTLNVPETENGIIKAIDMHDNLIIISAEAGMGKSTELTGFALDLKKKHPSWWIIRFNLNEHLTELDQWDGKDELCFVINMAKLQTELEKRIFENRLKETGEMVILLDGFDEISPKYKEKVIKIIDALKAGKLKKLCVTSRPHMKSLLENTLKVKPYMLKPFQERDHEEFLLKFWTKILTIKNEARVKKYMHSLLKVFFRSFRDSSFSGTPLNIKMLAEEFQESVKNFVDSNDTEPSLPPKQNIFSLYQKFVDKKIKIYLGEKLKTLVKSQGFNYVFQQVKENTEEKFKYHALMRTLFPKEAHYWMDKKKDNTSAEEIVRIGIVKSIDKDRTEFIHRTFAEYFAALWFATETNWKKLEVNRFIKNTIYSFENVTIRTFLDYALANNEIHEAILNKDSSRVRELLEHTEVDFKDEAGRTPLHLACAYGYEEVVKILLDKGANTKVTDDIFSWTPLTYSVTVGSWKGTREILINRRLFHKLIKNNYTGYTSTRLTPLLHSAAKNGNLEFVQLLINEEVSVDMKDQNDRTVLHAAAGRFDIISYFSSNDSAKKYFDKMMNSRDSFGKTPLHLAVECCNFDTIKFFVERGANVSATDNHGRSIMHIAANTCDLDTMKYLINHGVNIFVLDEHNRTPLHYVKDNEIFKITLLIDKVDPKYRRELLCTKDDCGLTGCQAVFKNILKTYPKYIYVLVLQFNKHIEKYEELRDIWEGRCENPINPSGSIEDIDIGKTRLVDDIGDTSQFVAVKNGEWDILDNWQKNSDQKTIRQSLSSTDDDGKTMLHHAFKNYSVEILSFLLTRSDIRAKDHSGRTPLHVAAMQSNLEPIKHLIEDANSYDDILALDNIDFTPIHYAVYNGNLEITKYLVEKLPEEEQSKLVGYRDKDSRTLIHLAFEKNYKKEIVAWLLDRGADIFAEDKKNNTTLDYAVSTSNLQAVKHILTHVKKINHKKVEKIIFQQNEPISPFISAIERGLSSIVQYFEEVVETQKLKKYIQSRLYDGRFILHCALNSTYRYNSDIVDWLIKTGADIFCRDRLGNTLLIAAVNAKDLTAVEHLMEHIKKIGQDTADEQILSLNNRDECALSLSLRRRNLEIYDYLFKSMQRERFAKMVKYDKNTSRKLLFYSTSLNNMSIVRQLITDGVDLFHKSSTSETILHHAARNKNFDVIKAIIDHVKHNNNQEILDEFILSETNYSGTALHIAIKKQTFKIAEYLAINVSKAKRSILINFQRTRDGMAALHLAIKNDNSKKFIAWLVKEGANIFAEDNKHQTVFHLPVGNNTMISFFFNQIKNKGDRYLNRLVSKQSDDNCTILHSLVNSKILYYKVMKIINIFDDLIDDTTIKHIIDIRNNENTTALCYAANGCTRAVKWLLSKGASFLNANKHETPLHIAARDGNTDMVRVIVEFVKEKHQNMIEDLMLARDDMGFTPFMLAISRNKWSMARDLAESISSELKNGLFTIPDNDNRFPIHLIFEKFNENLAEWSLKTDIRVTDSKDRTVLHSAVSGGKLVAVKFFVENIKKFNEPTVDWFILSKDTEGDTPVHLAIANNRADIVEYLFVNISANALKKLVDSKNKQGKTILHLALENCGKGIVDKIIQAGADILCKDKSNNTCLHFVFYNSDPECCAYFLEYFKYNVNDWKDWVYTKNVYGNTPLHTAASKNNFRNFQYLLQYLNTEEFLQLIKYRNRQERSALFFTVANSDIEFTKYLLNSGADASIKDSSNTTLLHEIKNTDMTKLLIDHIIREHGSNALVNLILKPNNQGCKAFHQYCDRDPYSIELLVNGLSDDKVKTIVNSRRSNKMTPLHINSTHFYYGVHKWLIKKGADVFAKDHSKRTVLHIAATAKKREAVIGLLNYIINNEKDCYEKFVVAEDNEGNNFVKMALEWGDFEVISYLFETLEERSLRMMLDTMNSHGESTLQPMFANFNRKWAEWLIENGASIFINNSNNETLLHTSVRNRNVEGVQYLIERIGDSVKFTDMLLTKTNKEGHTVLHDAVSERSYDIVKCLIENTDQSRVVELVNCANNDGQSALHLAIMKFHPRIVDFLLNMGANYCCKDNSGRSILHYVVDSRFFHVMQELVEILNQRDSEAFNKLANFSDNRGKTPFDEADVNCQDDIAEFLNERMDSTMRDL